MNKTLSEGIKLVSDINGLLDSITPPFSKGENMKGTDKVLVIIAPPYTHLQKIVELAKSKPLTSSMVGISDDIIHFAAQNCSSEPKGAYTGEISAEMILSVGAEYVIIGHSERRAYFKEDNPILLKKINLALENGLVPIFCCGEILAERNSNNHFNIVRDQIEKVIFNLSPDNFCKIIVAYEPVWAIGTGVTATPEQAQEMHLFIRKLILDKFGKEAAENTSILYGGSCKSSNAGELFAKQDIDGGLIGGASLNAEDFVELIKLRTI